LIAGNRGLSLSPLLLLIGGLAQAADLIVDGTTLTLDGSHSYAQVQVINGGRLTVTPYDGTGTTGTLTLIAEQIEVDASSAIIADSAGYRGQANADGEGPGGGQGGSCCTDAGGGGGHGGAGGTGLGDGCSGSQGSGGAAYADLTAVDIDMGSGGGAAGTADGDDGGTGGTGGGAIWLEAEVILLDGELTALGGSGSTTNGDAMGGGAGGGVLVFANELYCGGTIRVSGGGGGISDDGGGGGAGGVVKQFYDGYGLACTVELDGGAGGCSGADGSSGSDTFDAQDWDGDGVLASDGDCDPLDGTVTTGTTETCNGSDDDCDGVVDEGVTGSTTWYADADGDGHGDPGVSSTSCSEPSGYVTSADDCDDTNPFVSPSSEETCDGSLDEDCDGTVDEAGADGGTAYYTDADGDGFGDPATEVTSCGASSGLTSQGGDCDDGDPLIHPSAAESCDGVDNDCDGETDPSTSSDAATWYADADLDGYGDPGVSERSCSAPSGYVNNHNDCDDTDSSVVPGADEYCDGIDNDCDGDTDPDTSLDAPTWYLDGDGDGYGDPGNNKTACSQPSGRVADNSDCDDANPAVNQAADELCDGIDNDCDTRIDPDDSVDAQSWHLDDDGDGFGDMVATVQACTLPSGASSDNTDCDDSDAAVNPDGVETCNGIDDDCDTIVDPDDSVGAPSWFPDADDDGYGDVVALGTSCVQPEGTSADPTDCDDTDPSVNPEAVEIWYDSIDQDCDGNDTDQDGDGFDWDGLPDGQDCDDQATDVHPDADEIYYDGTDQDCDGESDYDADQDGWDSESWGGEDCDDADPDTWPGAPDEPGDGVIHDCDGSDEYDADGDGFDAQDWGGEDCDDARSDVYPGAEEVWYDGVDQDCDGVDDDQDGDGWEVALDCDDTDASVFPESEGLDADCQPLDENWWAYLRDDEGCGCAGAPAGAGPVWLALLGLVGLRRRP